MTTKEVKVNVVFEGKHCDRDCYALSNYDDEYYCQRYVCWLININRCANCIKEFGE